MKDEAELKESDSWRRFCATGKIEDYLQYASCRVSENSLHGMLNTTTLRGSVDESGLRGTAERIGDTSHAGFYSSNRNHTETDSYR